MSKGINPKAALGDVKMPLEILDRLPMVEWAMAQWNGATKYGIRNWRDTDISSYTYIAAIMRHLFLWICGEVRDKKSGCHHLGHIMSNCAILIDAEACDCLEKPQPSPSEIAALKLFYQFQDDEAGVVDNPPNDM